MRERTQVSGLQYSGRGKCYRLCGEYIIYTKEPDAVLVHGAHANPDGLTIDHAWIEIGDNVFNLTKGDAAIPKKVWYGWNRAIKKYSKREAMKMMLKTQHFGPWDAETLRLGDEARKRAGLT